MKAQAGCILLKTSPGRLLARWSSSLSGKYPPRDGLNSQGAILALPTSPARGAHPGEAGGSPGAGWQGEAAADAPPLPLACEPPSPHASLSRARRAPQPAQLARRPLGALGLRDDHAEVVAEDDPAVPGAAALGLAQSLPQPPPQRRRGRAQEVLGARQEIHHAAADRVPLDEALGDVPARRELVHAVLHSEPPQHLGDAAGGDVVPAVGGGQAVSVLRPQAGPSAAVCRGTGEGYFGKAKAAKQQLINYEMSWKSSLAAGPDLGRSRRRAFPFLETTSKSLGLIKH